LWGFEINPAGVLVPIFFAFFGGWGVVAFTVANYFPYFVVRLFGPIVGASLGAFGYRKLIGRHLPCDTCVVEEKKSLSTTESKASL
jgi:glycerol uptake facilitator protein